MAEPSISQSQSMDRNPSTRVSDAAASDLSSGDTPDRPSLLDRSPSRQSDDQNQLSLRNEEYRQLFRLPPDEVLIRDFNCALQENFLLQGHMYLFAHYICFYSNLFGFETKKIIPFHEITSVRRANAAAIFPTAIEIIAGGNKFFFTSFLSRDEAFKIINDGWLQHSNGVKLIADRQDSKATLNVQENGNSMVEKTESSRLLVDESDMIEKYPDCSIPEDLKLPVDRQSEILSTSTGPQDNVEANLEIVQSTEGSPSGKSLVWEAVDSDAPGVPEGYMMVAESKFPVKVEDFFHFFFSDDGVDFQDSFHRKCGDKDFRCSKWHPHEEFARIRDVSFQHPIKLYLGAKFGSCHEVQKYRVYRHSHLVVETSQEIADVPYGDYFRVEGLWDVVRDGVESKTSCVLRIYINVNFSKKTMFKGKIVQSTVDECRDAYVSWIDLAHKLLKQKSLEIQESRGHASNLIANYQICLEKQESIVEHLESNESTDLNVPRASQNSVDVNVHVVDSLQGSYSGAASVAASFRDLTIKFCTSLKCQSQTTLLLVISIAVILVLMQISILVLLSRPQHIHVVPQADCTSSLNRGLSVRGFEIALVDKQIKILKEEMRLFETLLDKMQQEHALLKLKLKDLENLRKQQR